MEATKGQSLTTKDLERLLAPSHIDVKAKCSDSYFPVQGLSLDFLLKTYRSQLDLQDMYDVERHVLKLTKRHRCSYTELIAQCPQYEKAVKAKADFFIVFDYTTPFAKLLSALQQYRRRRKDGKKTDIFVWISLFSVNQHYVKEKLFSQAWLKRTFKTHCPRTGHTLFVLHKHRRPVYSDKTWKVFELFLAARSQAIGSIDVCFGLEDETKCIEDLESDYREPMKYISAVAAESLKITVRKREPVSKFIDDLSFANLQTSVWKELKHWLEKTVDIAIMFCKGRHEEEPSSELFRLLNQAGALHYDQGNFTKAGMLLEEALALCIETYGQEHEETSSILNNLAQLGKEKGDFTAAAAMYKESLRIRRKIYGNSHPAVGEVLSNLAMLMRLTGELKAAESLMREAVVISKKQYGTKHPDYIRKLNNLSLVLKERSNYKGAIKLMRHCIKVNKKLRRESEPEYAGNLNNLAALLIEERKYKEAEGLLQESIAISKKLKGADHQDVALGLSNLAALFMSNGKAKKAEMLTREALNIDLKIYGPRHSSVALDYCRLADALRIQGRSKEAQSIWKRCVGLLEKNLEPNSVITTNFRSWDACSTRAEI